MKIVLGILILFILYYIILFLFIFKGNRRIMFFFNKKDTGEIPDMSNPYVLSESDIMGKSKGYRFNTTKTITLELELEIDLEYTEEFQEEELDEEAILLEEAGMSEYSSGVTYEELELAIDVVQNNDIPEEIEAEAGNIISSIEQTDMFELLIQFSENKNKVNNLLKKHVDSNS